MLAHQTFSVNLMARKSKPPGKEKWTWDEYNYLFHNIYTLRRNVFPIIGIQSHVNGIDCKNIYHGQPVTFNFSSIFHCF